MRVRIGEVSALLVAVTALLASGGASAAVRSATVHAAVSKTLGRSILVDSRGFTLYHRITEKKRSISCTGACRKSWPPLLVSSAKPVAGAGLKASELGTIRRPDGGVQVTYYGYALYRYSGDTRAGETNGQGAQDVWYALTPAGTVTKATPKTPSTTTPKTSKGGTPTTTTPAPSGTTTVDTTGCAPGQSVAQGPDGGPNGPSDDDDDNTGGPDDGDGCL